MRETFLWLLGAGLLGLGSLQAQESSAAAPAKTPRSPGRLAVRPPDKPEEKAVSFEIPKPAHAVKPLAQTSTPVFQVSSSRNPSLAPSQEAALPAGYFLPDRNEKPPITPENSNLNLPTDLTITATDTGETIILPAGTYRQILQLPIDSPLMQSTEQTRWDKTLPLAGASQKSKAEEPGPKPVWVRYESLEKIKIGKAERRGGIDLPSHGSRGLGPRVWYAKSETADLASSVFYFVFGGLGYSTANLLGWSSGNTREIPGDFEYRLIRQ